MKLSDFTKREYWGESKPITTYDDFDNYLNMRRTNHISNPKPNTVAYKKKLNERKRIQNVNEIEENALQNEFDWEKYDYFEFNY